MIKYKTRNYGSTRIWEIEVERETASSVWINGKRQAKASSYEPIYDSWAEAKEALLKKAELRLQTVRRSLQLAQDELGNIKGLKEPT